MFTKLPFEKFCTLAKQSPRVAVYQDIPGDQLTPVNAYLALKAQHQNLTLLESLTNRENKGRYSHLCFNPLVTFESRGKSIGLLEQGQTTTLQGDPLPALRQLQSRLHTATDQDFPGFAGGLVGFMSYDSVRLTEKLPERHPRQPDDLPDILFHYYQDHIRFDHQTQKVVLTTIVATQQGDLSVLYANAFARLKTFISQLQQTSVQPLPSRTTDLPLQVAVDISDQAYCDMVHKAKAAIYAGEIFQIVLSRCFQTHLTVNPFEVYRALRLVSPTPYLFYLTYGDTAIAGASPEKLVSLQDGFLESCPLAGTRARSTEYSDERLKQALREDPKEVAEHMMLVDLARNDLGKIAKPGSVVVSKLQATEQTSHVIHLSSTVQATIAEGYDALDALSQSLPAGTLSGAPKIRAMTLIDEIETSRRGLYGGTIVGIDSRGNLTSCIAIRMATLRDQIATIRTGAGIVFDSDPQAECDETRHKAQALLSAIALAQGALA